MGTMLEAKCNHCGFSHGVIYYGTGMRDMDHPPKVPAIRKDTGAFVVEPLSDDPNLRFYHQREMYEHPIEDFGIENFDIALNPTGNLCPSCGKFSMDFISIGNFD